MDKQWPAGCVWTTRGPCSDQQPVDRDLWDTPLRCCLAKQAPLPSPPLTQSAETLTGGPARNLYWQAAITNHSTERMPGSCMQTWQRRGFVVSASQRPPSPPPPSSSSPAPTRTAISKNWRLDFLGQREAQQDEWSAWKEERCRARRLQTHLLELPAVGHGGHHLRQLLLLALQHPVHMLDWDLRTGTNSKCHGDS